MKMEKQKLSESSNTEFQGSWTEDYGMINKNKTGMYCYGTVIFRNQFLRKTKMNK